MLKKIELENLLKKKMKQKEQIYTVEEAKQEEWLDSTDIMRMFHISESTMYRLRKSNEIPYTRLGKKYVYPKAYFTNSLMGKIKNKN
jgi:hypothetical protein